jgi:hypothetical protein
MASESGKVVASTWGKSQEKWWHVHGQSQEKWWQEHGVRVRKSSCKYMGSESGKVVASTWAEPGKVVASTCGQRESGKVVASTWGQTELGKVVRCGARITRVISRRYMGLRALGYPLGLFKINTQQLA